MNMKFVRHIPEQCLKDRDEALLGDNVMSRCDL